MSLTQIHVLDCTERVSLEALLLSGGIGDYEYLNRSRREVDGVDDREEWKELQVRERPYCYRQARLMVYLERP